MSEHPLRKYRKEHRLSQVTLGAMLRVSRMTVVRWEKWERLPDPDQTQIITDTTGIPARELRPDFAKLLGSAA